MKAHELAGDVPASAAGHDRDCESYGQGPCGCPDRARARQLIPAGEHDPACSAWQSGDLDDHDCDPPGGS